MVGVWKWSLVLWWLGADIWPSYAVIAANDTRDDIPSLDSEALSPDMVSVAAPKGSVIIDSPFDQDFVRNLPVVTSKNWYNMTSSGRGLRQIDQMFQQNYWLVGCHARSPYAAAARLKHLITQIRLNLKIIIREAQKGVDSRLGFQAFFKTNDNIPRVIQIFQNIANGDKLEHLNPKQGSSWLMSGRGRPIVGCASTAEDKVNGEAYQECHNPPRYAYQTLGSAWVHLCPSFWNVQQTPSASYCPQMHENGSLMEPDSLELHMNQQAIFVHEMVHMYLGLPFQSEVIEQYTLGNVIGLSGEEAVENASNYGYFYSAVIAACMGWP